MLCSSPQRAARSSVKLSDVFRLHSDAYIQANTLTSEQHKVVNAIKNCRTSVLGGHVQQCDHCDAIHCAYNSCRNRYCPTCESFKAAQWLQDRQAELLPVRYFHVVFTLPHELNHLVLYNKKTLYNLLFESAWKTLNTLGGDPRRLHGKMGMLSILHTWGQNVSLHNHVHCIVPGGALRSTGKWTHSKNYLFPIEVLRKLFRGIFVSQLRILYQQESLKLPDKLTETLFKKEFDALLNLLMKKEWVVYAKPPFAKAEDVLNYLGRYTHKIAISNHRIINVDEENVTFKWRDYADDNKIKIMKLSPSEFIRRFLLHVVPTGFMRIRSFGFLANAVKKNKISIIKKQLGDISEKTKKKKDVKTLMLELTGKDITLCSICKKGKLKRTGEIPSKWRKTIVDTS